MSLQNPSTYVAFAQSTMSEVDFLREVARRTGRGLLLDISNVHVCAVNHGFDPMDYIDAFPLDRIGEIHLAGFAEDRDADGAPLRIDAHDRPVANCVWTIYRRVIARTGAIPTLIEWDNDVPEFFVLAGQAARAQAVMSAQHAGTMRRVA